MIIGDACCGWKDFDERSAARCRRSSPTAPSQAHARTIPLLLVLLQARELHVPEGRRLAYEDAPCLEGITVGCRTAVVYSPADLTCGWDGHDHPRGLRVVIDQSRQIGANYVTYLLGSYQLGRFLSSTKVYHEADVRQPRRFHLRPARPRRRLGPRPLGGP